MGSSLICQIPFSLTAATAPVISSFSPLAGAPGASVIISGTNFSPVPSNNIVYFGATRAKIVAASTASITALVPDGATYDPITETTGGQTGAGPAPFLVSFAGAGTIDSSTLGPRVDIPMGQGPARIAIGDLDGDGKPDLVVAQSHDSPDWV